MTSLVATNRSARTSSGGPPNLTSATAFPPVGGFASPQGWQKRIRRVFSSFFGRVPLLGSKEQPVVPAVRVRLQATNNLRERLFKSLRSMNKMKEPDKPPNPPIYRVDMRRVEGFVVPAPESCGTPPSNQHLTSPIQPPSPLSLPAIHAADWIGETTSLSTSRPSSRRPPPLRPTKVESTTIDTESTSLSQHTVTQLQSTSGVTSVPTVTTTAGPDSTPTHGSSSPPSTNHLPPPSPFVECTPFIPAGTSRGGYVRKRNRKTDFCGGFSDVFRAEIRDRTPTAEPGSKQDVALKILRRVGLDGKQADEVLSCMIQRLNQEIITWIGLVHPNVVPLVGFTITPLPSLISPWFERGNIRIYLKRHPTANRLKLVYDVAKGLEYLHSQSPRIAHGDIKPQENVLIDDQGDALLSDFGLTTVLGDESWYTASHREGGSFRYMAPELLLGAQEDRTCSADVYSFASLAFEVLTGRLPHSRLKTDNQICVSMSSAEGPEYPVDDWSNLPELEPIQDILRSCWSRRPEERPSMKEIVEKLSILVRGTDA